MGFLDMLFGAGGSILGSAADFGFQALANETLGMSKAQREMNDFTAAEAQKARDFSAQEAEINRDWQEEMYSKYNSLQGKMQQAREAGVNPMFAVTGSATSPMSASPAQPSAPAASGSSASPVGQISDMVGAALGFSKLQSEIKNIKAQTRSMNAKALVDELNATWVDKLNSQTIAESVKRIEVADVDINFKNQQISELVSRILVNDATVQEKRDGLALIAAQVANTEQNTRNAAEQFRLISAQVSETEASAAEKRARHSLILAQCDSEALLQEVYKVQPDLIKRQSSEIRWKIREAKQRIKSMEQEFGHKAIMNGFREYAALLEQESIEFHNPQSQLGQACKWLVELLAEVISLGGYTSFSTSHSTTNSQSTVTTIDGNPQPSRSKVGF